MKVQHTEVTPHPYFHLDPIRSPRSAMGCPWWVTGDPRPHEVTSLPKTEPREDEELQGRASRASGWFRDTEHLPLQSSLTWELRV